MGRPLVGLSVSVAPVGDSSPVDEAREAERLGFDFVSVADHPFGGTPTNEPWVTLAWIGAVTTRIGLLTRVIGLPFRHPALVAKMAETLDRLADGRLVVGLGGGGADDKMCSVGITPPSAREKIAALAEATAIMKGLWSEPRFTFHGQRYVVERADLMPKPAREIPIWLGALGPRGAELAGAIADGWIPYLRYVTPDRLRTCRRRVSIAAERAGRDPSCVKCVLCVQAHVGALDETPANAITGEPQEIAESLSDLLSIGFDGVNISVIGPDRAGQAVRFAEEVLSKLVPGQRLGVTTSPEKSGE